MRDEGGITGCEAFYTASPKSYFRFCKKNLSKFLKQLFFLPYNSGQFPNLAKGEMFGKLETSLGPRQLHHVPQFRVFLILR